MHDVAATTMIHNRYADLWMMFSVFAPHIVNSGIVSKASRQTI